MSEPQPESSHVIQGVGRPAAEVRAAAAPAIHSPGAAHPFTRRRFLRLTGATVAGLAFGEALIACAPRTQGGQAVATRPITIGFLTALSGPDGIYGKAQHRGLQLAVDEVNAQGGIAGRHVQVVSADDQGKPAETARQVERLVKGERVDVIVGLVTSTELQAALSALPSPGPLLLYTAPSEGGACSRNLVSMGQILNQQVEPFLAWLLKNIGRTVFTIGSDDPRSRATVSSIKAALDGHTGMLAGSRTVPVGTTDFKATLSDARTVNPDILFFTLDGADSMAFAHQLASVDLHSVIATTTWDEVLAAGAPDKLTGTLTSQAWFSSLDTPVSRSFLQRYQNRFEAATPASAMAEASYDAVHLYKAAVERARTTELDGVLKAMVEVEFAAPQGPVRIDGATQVIVANSRIGQVSGQGTIRIHQELGPIRPVVAGCGLR